MDDKKSLTSIFTFSFHRNGSRLSSARAFLRPKLTQSRNNLHVMINSTATKILVNNDKGQKTVAGVEFVYTTPEGKTIPYKVRVSKEVILSAGAVNSPQVLLLSGIGPKAELDKVGIAQVHELPGVGKNLHNHVTFYLNFLLRKRRAVSDLDWVSALEYLLQKRGPMSSTGMSQVNIDKVLKLSCINALFLL